MSEINEILGVEPKKENETYENGMISENGIAVVLKIMAWVTMAAGLIAGFGIANVTNSHGLYSGSTEFVWQLGLPYWIGGVVSGIVLLGFAEIIDLLHRILSRLRN
jgi:hypothetical protein